MIKRVSLHNWKSHLDSEISFSGGVNALVGIMGSGKSSIMQAISFALFGTFSGLDSRRLSMDDLIMNKPQKKGSASVEVEFDLDGHSYSVKREIERGKGTTTAEMRKDGELLEVNAKSVTAEAEKALQMEYDLFQRAVYSEQNALEHFLQIPKGKRMKQIDEMLKLDDYEKARRRSVTIRNRLIERRKERLRTIEDMKERDFEARIRELRKGMREKEKSASSLERKLKRAEKQRRKMSEKLVTYESEQDMLEDEEKSAAVIGSRIAEIRKQIERKRSGIKGKRLSEKETKRLGGEISRIEARIEDRESRIKSMRDRVSAKNSEISYLKKQNNEALVKISRNKEKEMELEDLEESLEGAPEKKLEEAWSSLEDARKRLYSLEGKKKEIQKALSELKGTGNVCPLCESPLSGERKEDLINHRTRHIGELESEMSEREEEVKKREEEVAGVRKSMERYRELKRELGEIGDLRDKVRENEEAIGTKREEINNMVPDIQNYEEKVKELRKSLGKARLRKERIEDLLKEREEIKELESEEKGLSSEKKEHEKKVRRLKRKLKGKDLKKLREDLQELVGKCGGMESDLRGAREIIMDRKSSLEDLGEQKKTFERYAREAEGLGTAVDSTDRFVSVLSSTQDQLRDAFLRTVNGIMNEVWAELYPYGDFSEIRLAVERDYVLQLRSSAGWTSADLVSGGERSLAALALRIAFSLAFTPNLKWLILDEPTHNLDANAIDHFGNVLRERMDKIIDQVFIITHEERLSDYVTGSVHKLERDKEEDGVTRIFTETSSYP